MFMQPPAQASPGTPVHSFRLSPHSTTPDREIHRGCFHFKVSKYLHNHSRRCLSTIMADDPARAGAPKAARPPEKRKKRKLKKKKQPANLKVETSLPPLEPAAEKSLEALPLIPPAATVPMSPRKQTLLRHKNSDQNIGEPLFVSKVKELKNRKQLVPTNSVESEYGKFSIDLNQTTEGKVSLFKCAAARIVVYHEQLVDSGANASSGTLLGHGEFEIFQLHNGDVTYLSCGRSFVYPLLPKLKMLRVDKNHFILPLVNPQRYWKIHIDSQVPSVIGELEVVLKKLVNYTNLSFIEQEKHEEEVVAVSEKQTPQKNTHYTPFFHDIPELPPSAPVSPNNLNLFAQDTFQLLPTRKPEPALLNKKSNQSLNSALASLSLAEIPHKPKMNGAGNNTLLHPRPVTHANPYRRNHNDISDRHSDLSSMDSLLDEYEENISTTKSINFNVSRPPSRAVSITSSTHPPPVQYHRGKVALFPDRMSNLGSHYGTVEEDDEEDDDFPTTSLSQYNRAKQNSRSVRSRRSSPSELYTSVSNWMEPGGPKSKAKLAHSRSTYSLASKKSVPRPSTLNDTYREIYRSITLHNLSLIVSGRDRKEGSLKGSVKGLVKPVSDRAAPSPYYSKLLVAEQSARRTSEREPREQKKKSDGLSSNEVYRLLSSRDQQREKPKGLGLFLGW